MTPGNSAKRRPLVTMMWTLSIVVFLGGCSSAKFIATGSPYPARPDDCPIEIFSSRAPDRDYEELGIIEGEGSLGFDTLERILPKMRLEACRAGGDAIILMSNQTSVNVYEDTSDEKLRVTATVIRWTE